MAMRHPCRRGDGERLANRYTGSSIVGSNPTPSDSLLICHKGNGRILLLLLIGNSNKNGAAVKDVS